MKERLDTLLVNRGLVESREKAQRLIMAAQVRVDGHPATKAGVKVPADVAIEVIEGERFVSRGGKKLEAAFESFPLSVDGVCCLDIGASTGGFTDCLLQHGAQHVTAVDVGKGQLHWSLRNDSRVTVREGVNARYLVPGDVEGVPAFTCVDVSFISLRLILPALQGVMTSGGEAVTLIKPQFEAGREQVGKGGVVRDDAVRQAVVERIRSFGESEVGLVWKGCVTSPIKGPAGNVEFVVWWKVNDSTS